MSGLCVAFRSRLREPEYRRKLLHTICIFYSFALVGICCSITGPALLDLRIISHTDTTQAAVFITGSSIGSMIGSLTMGSIFGRLHTSLLMSLTLFGAAGALTSIPWCTQYDLMIFMHALAAFFRAGFNAAGNSDIIKIWDSERRIFLQILHFSFALGGTVAPLIVQPFLAPKTNTTTPTNTSSLIPTTLACVEGNSTGDGTTATFANYTFCNGETTDVQYAYLITGSLLLFGAIIFIIQFFCNRDSQDKSAVSNTEGYETLDKPLPMSILIVTVALILSIFVFIVAIEASLMAWILTFVVTYLEWSKSAGANLTSVFWACYSAFRFATIFFTDRVSPFAVLIITSTVALASSAGTLLSSMFYYGPGIWITIAISGLSLASQVPSTLNWAQESIIRLSPRIVSLVVFACTIPGVVNPLLIGHFMQEVSPIWLFYILTTESGLCVFLILVLYIWNRLVVQPTQEKLNAMENVAVQNDE